MIEQFSSPGARLGPERGGPLSAHIDSFAGLLTSQGYSTDIKQRKIKLAVDLSAWLDQQELSVVDLDEMHVGRFLTARRGSAASAAVTAGPHASCWTICASGGLSLLYLSREMTTRRTGFSWTTRTFSVNNGVCANPQLTATCRSLEPFWRHASGREKSA